MSTFVSVGNAQQPFIRLIKCVVRIARKLPHPVIIQHGNTSIDENNNNCQWLNFLELEEFQQKINNSELLILHSGAGSLIHAIRAGKVPVVMPRRVKYGEHIDDHQLELAEALSGEGKVVVAYEPEDLKEAVEKALMLQTEERKSFKREMHIIKLIENVLLDIEKQKQQD